MIQYSSASYFDDVNLIVQRQLQIPWWCGPTLFRDTWQENDTEGRGKDLARRKESGHRKRRSSSHGVDEHERLAG
jgi:hypothetical protein